MKRLVCSFRDLLSPCSDYELIEGELISSISSAKQQRDRRQRAEEALRKAGHGLWATLEGTLQDGRAASRAGCAVSG